MKITKNICIMKIFSSTVNAMREVGVRDLLSRRPFCPAGELPPFAGRHISVPETSPSTMWALAETWPWPRSSRALRTRCSWGDAAPWVFQSRYTVGTPSRKGCKGDTAGDPPLPFALPVWRMEGSGTRVGCGGAPKQGTCSPDC